MTVRGLKNISRCRGCGGWRWSHRDLRPCSTCLAIGYYRAGRKAVGA